MTLNGNFFEDKIGEATFEVEYVAESIYYLNIYTVLKMGIKSITGLVRLA